jgi:hypothetical protein
MILIYSAALGLFPLIFSVALSRRLQIHDLFGTGAWLVGAFAFMPMWLFLRGKTSERTLTVSPDGISTQIGSLKGQVPWSKVRLAADAGIMSSSWEQPAMRSSSQGGHFRGPSIRHSSLSESRLGEAAQSSFGTCPGWVPSLGGSASFACRPLPLNKLIWFEQAPS